MNTENIKNWSETISYAAKPLIEHKSNERIYLTKKVGENAIQKYKVSEIVDISRKQLINAEFHHKVSGELSEKEFTDYTSIIKENTLTIINAREAKRNTLLKKLFRSVAFVTGILLTASVAGAFLGIPIIYVVLKSNKDFKKEIQNLKNQLNTPTEGSQIIREFTASHPQSALINNLISEIPTLFSNFSDEMTLENLQEDLSALSKRSDDSLQEKRGGDFEGGTKFIRIDKNNNIKDKSPIPTKIIGKNITDKEKRDLLIKDADHELNELIVTEEDKKWVTPLKLLTNQLLANACLQLKMHNPVIANKYKWNEGNNDFRLQFSNNEPIIELEIIRDENQNILRIEINLLGKLNLVAKNVGAGEEERLLIPSVVEVGMTFTANIDENNQLVISNLQSSYDYSR